MHLKTYIYPQIHSKTLCVSNLHRRRADPNWTEQRNTNQDQTLTILSVVKNSVYY